MQEAVPLVRQMFSALVINKHRNPLM